MVEFCMPSLGTDMEAGTLVEWRVKPGDTVKRGDIIAEVETQKGLIEIEVFDDGKIDKLVLNVGQKVPVGTVMAIIDSGKQQVTKKSEKAEAITAIIPPHRIKASPLAKKIAAENNIDITKIQGTGESGAITKEDVEKLLGKGVISKPATTESMRAAVAAAMSRSNREIPHYYIEAKVDMRSALLWLEEENKKRTVEKRLLIVVLLIKAVAKALTQIIDLNAYCDNDLQLKDNINVGFVVSLRTGGIVVPTIHNADKKNPDEIMEALNDIISRARSIKLRSSDLVDSTVTITNLGEGSAEMVLGIIYPPQVALIGFGGINEQPWAENGMLDVRPVVTITLAADHRATDGIVGNRFVMLLKDLLQKPADL